MSLSSSQVYAHKHPLLRAQTSARSCPALRCSGSLSLRDAVQGAHNVLSAAEHCPRSKAVLAKRFEKLGSVLFLDDDPAHLILAFDAEERDAHTLRLLAACVLVHGRERTTLTH